MRIYKEFLFEAAHHLPNSFAPGHPNFRLHGHSFRVRVTVEGKPDEQGLLMDLGVLYEHLARVRDKLDHRYLNEISGLENPTLENISILSFFIKKCFGKPVLIIKSCNFLYPSGISNAKPSL
jgi:6-pyruvoyltetrahydropterin/6-carboxytetrahydropterin synthase